MLPDDREVLVSECCEDIEDGLSVRAREFPEGTYGAAAGLPDLAGGLAPLVSGALDLAVVLLGPTFDRLVTANRDNIRAVISDHTLAFIDGLIHDLQLKTPS